MTGNSPFDPNVFGLADEDLVSERLVQSVIAAAGSSVTGRTRLQKLVFLLDQLGLKSGFEFAYHHYGPYSSDLTNAVDFSKAFGLIEEEFEYRKSDGARYSKFTVKSLPNNNSKAEFFERDHVKNAINLMNDANATVLELAGTIYWLKFKENCQEWKKEIVRRKGQKTEEGRLQKALDLLAAINLSIEASSHVSA